MKEKKYTTIIFENGISLTDAITRLVAAAAKGKFVCGKFCGITLYSDTVSFDSAFKQISGQSYFAALEASSEHEEEIVQRYIVMGQQLINSRLWSDWETYVRASMGGEYHGLDITCALSIMQELQAAGPDAAYRVLCTQSHTKATLSLVLSIIRSFSRGGDSFVQYVTEHLRNPK